MFRPVPVLDIRSWAQGQDWEDSEVRVAWWEHQCSHPAVIWYHQYRVKPSSIFCSIPIINCLPHQEPGRIPKWIWASSDIRSQSQTKNASRYFEQVRMEASVGSVIRLILLSFSKDIKWFFSRAKFPGFSPLRDISTFLLEQITPTKRLDSTKFRFSTFLKFAT